MSASPDEIIKAEDFRSIQVMGTMYNQTSKVAVRTEPTNTTEIRIKKSDIDTSPEKNSLPCEVVEFLEDGFGIEVAARSCAVGHELKLVVEILNIEPRRTFKCTVKVTELEALDYGRQKISTRFVHYDEKEWLAFQEFFSETQDRLLELFHSIRGH